MNRFLFAFVLSFFLLLSAKSTSYALEKITTTAYDIMYSVENNGLTTVLFTISLTNTTSDQYASAYSLKVGFDNLANLKASDPEGPIIPTLKQEDDGYLINLPFNKRVVGKGNTLTFTLSFTTSDIVQRNGSVWEVNIPGVANKNEFSKVDTHVKVPSFLGKPSYVKPQNTTGSLNFTKDQLGKSGISLFFGKEQLYEFLLTYHLQNTNLFPITTEIALPPSTNYQEVVFDSLSPKPQNVRQDIDGNWLAQYLLKPSQKVDVTAKGKVKISLLPKQQSISTEERRLYTGEQPYWQKNNTAIKALAQKLKTPEAIYNYVVTHLTYDFTRVTEGKKRIGAQDVLEHPDSAVCLEFTDLFIAIARAAGIPAREVDGFAYTQNVKQRPVSLLKDVLHAWPEYYDETKKTWVMIDPTWGNTTGGTDYFHGLDFDHFAFAKRGKSSTSPLPAGGYKLPNAPEVKDVIVTLTQTFEPPVPQVNIASDMPIKATSGFPVFGTITIKNITGTMYPEHTLHVNNNVLSPNHVTFLFPAVLPYGTSKQSVYLGNAPFLTNTTAPLTIRVAGEKIEKNIVIAPITDSYIVKGGLLFAGITIILFIIATITGRLHFFRQKR